MDKGELSLDSLPYIALFIDENAVIFQQNYKAKQTLGHINLIGQKLSDFLPDFSLNLLTKLPLLAQKFTSTESAAQQYSCDFTRIDQGYLVVIHLVKPNYQTSQDVSILESSNIAYCQWICGQSDIYCSSSLMTLMGYEKHPRTINHELFINHISQDAYYDLQNKIAKITEDNQALVEVVYPIQTVSKELVWVVLKASVVDFVQGKANSIIVIVSEISASKAVINALSQKNEYLELAESLSHSGHWNLDVINKTLFFSNGVYQLLGVTPEAYQPSFATAINFFSEDQQEIISNNFSDAIAKKRGFHLKTTLIKAPHFEKIKIEMICDVKLDDNGEVCNIFGIFKDITTTETIFEKLKLLALVNYTIKVPIFFIDEKDNIVYQDLSPQKDNKSSVLFNFVNFTIAEYLQLKHEAKAKGQIKRNAISFDQFHTVFNFSITYTPDEGVYIWIVDNVTEQYHQEQQQAISNRLTLLGNTFGSVSHDINNVLGVALGATEMLELKSLQGSSDITPYIDRVKNAIDKGKNVTQRLLAFTRKPMIKVVEFDPVQEIKDNRHLLEQMLLSTISFELDLIDTKCIINFPQGEFTNILINILLNAQDAIKEKQFDGVIKLSTEITADGKFAVTIKDSGIGISQDIIAKIFDPFFSSKKNKQGNGIGLANVYATMYKYHGEILVDGASELGGAQFTLLFPCDIKSGQNKINTDSSENMRLDNQKILILDDEVSISEFVSMFLEGKGAMTNHITNKDSLESILAGNIEYTMFITDMVLPDISGKEAVKLVLKRFPNIKILSMSGYINDKNDGWPYPVLRKPFNSTELFEFVNNH